MPPPERKKLKIGNTTMPNGDRRICGIGFKLTCPPIAAVESPPIFAARAWDASWHVVEKRKTMYEMNPNISVSGVRLFISNSA